MLTYVYYGLHREELARNSALALFKNVLVFMLF